MQAKPKCPYCGYEDGFKLHKTWKFKFYNVERLECPKCRGIFNHYHGVSPRGKTSEFIIRVKPRTIQKKRPAEETPSLIPPI
jgi:Zn-finger nucleic acid-binding protein